MTNKDLDNGQDHAADIAAYVSAESYRSQLWLIGVVGLPFIILVALSGWDDTFRSGDASAFISGAVIAALAENIIERVKEHTLNPRTSVDLITAVMTIYAIGFLVWNGLFAVADKSFQHPSVDWVQVVAFFVTAFSLPLVRGFGYMPPQGGDANPADTHARSTHS
jgi:hypothetical protein